MRRNSRAFRLFVNSFNTSASVATLAAALVASGSARADSVLWQGTTSNWFSDTNWVWDWHTPTAADSARIDGGTPSPIIAGGAAAAAELYIGIGSTSSLSVTGGSLATGSATLGYNALSSGTVSVTGASTSWSTTTGLYVGNAGSGTVNVNGGATLSAGTFYLGAASGGAGSVSLDGASTLSTTGSLFVGYGGTGELTVNSGSVQSAQGVLGNGAGSSGQVTVSGATSSWTNTGTLVVGGDGQGTLTISGGGSVSNAVGAIGNGTSGTTSTVLVTGTGSLWASSGALYVGVGANAALDVEAGGQVTSTGAVIGRFAGSSSIATVNGTGSSWSTGALIAGGDNSVAGAGTGTLNIGNGGAVTSTSASLGDVAHASGTVTVDGAHSSWTVGGRIGVGTFGAGALTISNGAEVSSAGALVGWNAGSTGTANVDGAGSRWINTGTLFVGNVGNGTLTVSGGAGVTSVDGYVASEAGSTSSATITGTNSSWSMSGDLFVGHNAGATGSMVISGGAVVNNGNGILGDLAGSSGTMLVTGAGSAWNSTADVNVGRLGNGSLTISDGGIVTGDRGYIGNEVPASGTALVTGAGSAWITAQRLYVGADGNGELTVADNGRVAASAIRLAYSPGTTGTLNIGAAAGSAAASPGVLDTAAVSFGSGDGRLVFNHTSDNYVFAPALSGNGRVDQLAGTTVLTGDSSAFTGMTAVSGGTLAVNGSLGGTLTVASGATLTGVGSVGTTSIATGGAIAPGGPTGTLAVNGNFTQAAGSIYRVNVDPGSTSSSRIVVAGSANINGATLDWTKLGSGSFAAGTRYTVLTATGGVTGTYLATTHSLSNFYALTASYDANDAYLDVAQVRSFAAAAGTPNQAAAARGLQSLSSGALRDSLNVLPSDAAARTAFDSLSGEAYASVNRVLISDSYIVRDAAIDRIRAAFGGIDAANMQTMAFAPASSKPITAFASLHDGSASGLTSAASWNPAPVFWSRGFGAWEKAGSNGDAAGLTSSSSGFLTGADVAAFDTWRVGLYAGYSRTNIRVADRASAGSSDNYDLGIYGGTQWNHLGLRLGAAYSWHDVTMNRTAAFAGFSDVLTGRYDAATFQTFGELGYRTDVRHIAVEPFAALAYIHFSNNGFAETGGPAALSSSAADTDTVFATLGIRGATQVSFGGFTGSLHAMGGWRTAAGMTSPASTLAFAGSDAFSVTGLPIARNAAATEAGFDVNLSSSISFGLSYSGQFGDRATEQNAKGNLIIRF